MNVVKSVQSSRLKCGLGLYFDESCSERCQQRKLGPFPCFFNFDVHKRGQHCLRCGDTNHRAMNCPTKFVNIRLRPKPFPEGVCGVCGLLIARGHGTRLGEEHPLFHHDRSMPQTLDSSWRRADKCNSGFCDLFYPLLYLSYVNSQGKKYLSISPSYHPSFVESNRPRDFMIYVAESYKMDNDGLAAYVHRIGSLEGKFAPGR